MIDFSDAAPQFNFRPRESIAELKARADIVDIIGRHTKLKKQGRHEHSGCCPFHTEKTPSFKVDQSRQTYHCFGCGARGDALDFLAAIEGLNKIDAQAAAPDRRRQQRATPGRQAAACRGRARS